MFPFSKAIKAILWADVHGKGFSGLLVVLEAQQVGIGEHQVLFLLAKHGAAGLHFAVQQRLAWARKVVEVHPIVGEGTGAGYGRGERLLIPIRQAHSLERAKDGVGTLGRLTQDRRGRGLGGGLGMAGCIEGVVAGGGEGGEGGKGCSEGSSPPLPQQVGGLLVVP